MPTTQTINATANTAEGGSSPRAAARSMPTPRQMREHRFRQLLRLQRVLMRLSIERALHGDVNDSDRAALDAVDVEEQLEREFATRWSHVRPQFLLEEAQWWAEQHTTTGPCPACELLNRVEEAQPVIPAPRKTWE